jgi:pimeloyl-ACP methyl ester carboxylesterase
MQTSSPDDEFALLAEEAAEHGITYDPAFTARRVTIATHPRISALRWGSATPRFTFLHGVGLNAHTWDTTFMDLGVDGIAVDLPGHGDSAWFDDADYSPATLARAIASSSVADHRTALIGHSLGGLAAIALADLLPDSFSHLVVIDITPGLVLGDNNVVREFLAGPKKFPTRDAIVDRALSFGFGPSRRAVERGVQHNTRLNDDGTYSYKHHIAHLEQRRVTGSDFAATWEPAGRLGIPVLLIRGERGFLSDTLVKEFLDRVPQSTAVTLTCGHNVQEEAPRALAGALRSFVD